LFTFFIFLYYTSNNKSLRNKADILMKRIEYPKLKENGFAAEALQ